MTLKEYTNLVVHNLKLHANEDVRQELETEPVHIYKDVERRFKAGWIWQDTFRVICLTSEEYDEDWACREQAKLHDKYVKNSAGLC